MYVYIYIYMYMYLGVLLCPPCPPRPRCLPAPFAGPARDLQPDGTSFEHCSASPLSNNVPRGGTYVLYLYIWDVQKMYPRARGGLK